MIHANAALVIGERESDMRRDKNKLIPSEKSKKVLYLEQQGKVERGVPWGAVLFWILGLCCILYCIGVAIVGFGTYFFLVWGLIGFLSLLVGIFLSNRERVRKLPKWLRIMVTVIFLVGVILFCAVEGLILSQYNAKPQPGADYIIILGAQWKTSGPSDVLRRRLDKAVEYLKENPDTIVIVSGGQGSNEPISEAAGMRQYLVNAGISDDKILVEDSSTNTMENLVFSGRLLNKESDTVVIVTNNFHVFRALKIAEKQGYANAEGMAASAVVGLVPNNLLREFLGVVKDFLKGNL